MITEIESELIVPLTIEFDYSPPEVMTRVYPGSPEEIDITSRKIGCTDLRDWKRVDTNPLDEVYQIIKQARGHRNWEAMDMAIGNLSTVIGWIKKSPSFQHDIQEILDDREDEDIKNIKAELIESHQAMIEDRADAEHMERRLRRFG